MARTVRLATVLSALLGASCTSDGSDANTGIDAGDTDGASVGGASSGGSSQSGGAPSAGGTPSSGGAGGRISAGGSGPGGASTGTGGVPGSGGAPALSPRRDACPPGQTYGNPLPASRVASPVQRGFGFIEGPVWVAATSRLLFSDMDFGGGDTTGPPSTIRRLDPSGGTPAFDVFADIGGSNGLALANDGRVLAATHDVQSLTYFDAVTGARTNWPLLFETHHFNSPNDLVVRSDGNVYFTDPDWQLGSRTSEIQDEGVYRVSPSGDVTSIDAGFDKPNGITLSLDENTLYVGGRSGGISQFSLDAAGASVSKDPFVAGSTDGMTLDCAGNVYVTSGDVIVYSPAGAELGRITLDRGPSNVAFGGLDRRTLYITAEDALFSIDLNVPGMPY